MWSNPALQSGRPGREEEGTPVRAACRGEEVTGAEGELLFTVLVSQPAPASSWAQCSTSTSFRQCSSRPRPVGRRGGSSGLCRQGRETSRETLEARRDTRSVERMLERLRVSGKSLTVEIVQ